MATPTYTPIASITLGSSASSVTFSSIPQDYRDLIVVCNSPVNTAQEAQLRFNSDTGSNYSSLRVLANASVQISDTTTTTYIRAYDTAANIHNTAILQIMDYSATDKHKTVLIRNGKLISNEIVIGVAGRWANTNAITTLSVSMPSATFNTGSTFALYGIEA